MLNHTKLLVLELLELHPGGLSTGARLQPGEDGADLVLTLLLHPATNAGPEEDEGVAQPELLLVQLHLVINPLLVIIIFFCTYNVHDGLGGSLVILGLGNGGGADDVVPGLELGVGQLVGETG